MLHTPSLQASVGINGHVATHVLGITAVTSIKSTPTPTLLLLHSIKTTYDNIYISTTTTNTFNQDSYSNGILTVIITYYELGIIYLLSPELLLLPLEI